MGSKFDVDVDGIFYVDYILECIDSIFVLEGCFFVMGKYVSCIFYFRGESFLGDMVVYEFLVESWEMESFLGLVKWILIKIFWIVLLLVVIIFGVLFFLVLKVFIF